MEGFYRLASERILKDYVFPPRALITAGSGKVCLPVLDAARVEGNDPASPENKRISFFGLTIEHHERRPVSAFYPVQPVLDETGEMKVKLDREGMGLGVGKLGRMSRLAWHLLGPDRWYSPSGQGDLSLGNGWTWVKRPGQLV